MDDEKLHHDEDESEPSVAEGEPYELQDDEEAAAEHRLVLAGLQLGNGNLGDVMTVRQDFFSIKPEFFGDRNNPARREAVS